MLHLLILATKKSILSDSNLKIISVIWYCFKLFYQIFPIIAIVKKTYKTLHLKKLCYNISKGIDGMNRKYSDEEKKAVIDRYISSVESTASIFSDICIPKSTFYN